MIHGAVNARHEVVVPLPVRSASGQEQQIDTVLDTGFTGSLTLPPSVIAGLALSWHSRGQAALANGTVEQFEICAATVV